MKYHVEVNDFGTIRWKLNGKRHREDGPAVEGANGSKFWYRNGKLHREDGPAIEYADGSKFWYLVGKEYTEAEFLKKTWKKSSNTGTNNERRDTYMNKCQSEDRSAVEIMLEAILEEVESCATHLKFVAYMLMGALVAVFMYVVGYILT